MIRCPLCDSGGEVLAALLPQHLHCHVCDLRFLQPANRLTEEEEKARYLTHNNDLNDEGYRKFLSPLANEIKSRVAINSRGLDYGAGPGPALAAMLGESGFDISLYDPFFWPDPRALEKNYDFVLSSEVIEHFFFPAEEFKKLRTLVKPNGLLALMTHIFQPGMDFSKWYYHRDPTHVVFYSEKTLLWIRDRFGFSSLTIIGERIALLN